MVLVLIGFGVLAALLAAGLLLAVWAIARLIALLRDEAWDRLTERLHEIRRQESDLLHRAGSSHPEHGTTPRRGVRGEGG